MPVTTAQLDPERVEEIAQYLKRGRDGDVALKDVMALAELMVGSMQSFFEALDSSVYKELREIAEYISTAKDEIRNLQANDIKQNRIPEAGMELDAIVQATEQATNTIMEQAERLIAADPSDAGAYQDEVNDAVMQIFEACSFQDITGQRISKVVETLNFIDHRVARLADVIGCEEAGEMTEEEVAREKRKEELLLHGPQSAQEAISQEDIDKMLGASEAPEVSEAGDAGRTRRDRSGRRGGQRVARRHRRPVRLSRSFWTVAGTRARGRTRSPSRPETEAAIRPILPDEALQARHNVQPVDGGKLRSNGASRAVIARCCGVVSVYSSSHERGVEPLTGRTLHVRFDAIADDQNPAAVG